MTRSEQGDRYKYLPDGITEDTTNRDILGHKRVVARLNQQHRDLERARARDTQMEELVQPAFLSGYMQGMDAAYAAMSSKPGPGAAAGAAWESYRDGLLAETGGDDDGR